MSLAKKLILSCFCISGSMLVLSMVLGWCEIFQMSIGMVFVVSSFLIIPFCPGDHATDRNNDQNNFWYRFPL